MADSEGNSEGLNAADSYWNKLSAETRKDLTKCATDRLRARLVKRGYDEDNVYEWDRPTILETYAQVLWEAGQPDPNTTLKQELQNNQTERELDLKAKELKIREAELKFKMAEADKVEKTRKEQWQREDTIRAEQQKHEAKLKQLELDNAIDRQKTEIDARDRERIEQNRLKYEQENTLINRTKKYADAMKHILSDMPADSPGLVEWFQSIDSLYELYHVPQDLRAKLLLPKLTGKARILIEKLSVVELDDYKRIKAFLLEEYHITPRELRSRFMTASKRSDETYTLFGSRLHTVLLQYLRSRKADVDINVLIDLLVADRMKECMPLSILQYVLGLEGRDCFSYKDVASKADIYASNFTTQGQYRANQTFSVPLHYSQSQVQGRSMPLDKFNQTGYNREATVTPRPINSQALSSWRGQQTGPDRDRNRDAGGGDRFKLATNRQGQSISCWRCGGNHRQRDCPQPPTKLTAAKGLACTTLPTVVQPDAEQTKVTSQLTGNDEWACSGIIEADSGDESEADEMFLDSVIPSMAVMQARSTLTGHEMAKPDLTVRSQKSTVPSLQLSELETIKVSVDGHEVTALIDSGSQFPLVRQGLISTKDRPLSTFGTISIQPIVGQPRQAKLVACHLARVNNSCTCIQSGKSAPVPHVICAAIPDLACYDLILPPSVAQSLAATCIHSQHEPCLDESNNTQPPDIEITAASDESITVAQPSEHDSGNEQNDEFNLSHSNSSDLINEQQTDETLLECIRLAKQRKGGYFIRDSILFHKDRVCGHSVDQLVLPLNRRSDVLKLAHDKCGFHQRHRKTIERIRRTFYWPNMRKDIVKYCDSCEPCQLHNRKLETDKTPIDSIERPELPGQHLMMDCVGPIDPPSSQRHIYLLVVIDVCTSWPFIYPIRNLTAQTVCDCLIDLFSNFGVPSVLSSDNGSNFTSQLTRCLLERIGCSPRYASPGHPSCHGKIERLNGTIKRLLHHVIIDNARKWHQFIPFIVWTLRESSSETTGISPYTLLYGHQPRGPLAILKESWTGENVLPSTLKMTDIEYLQNLNNKLKAVRDYADRNAVINQDRYVKNYNKNTKTKQFEKDQKVIVLIKDSSNHLLSRWQVGTIAEVKSPFSYLVDLSNGARAHIHIDKIRPFIARAQAIIFEQDKEFGDIHAMPPDAETENLPSHRIDKADIDHLSETDQQTLRNLLDEFRLLFSDHPGFYDKIEH